jgi:DNA polymerase
MLVGEQPGDREDETGKPFVGPAGRILDRALAEAGIDRGRVYVTNIVKHFKWRPSGKRRLHVRPSNLEVGACRPWFDRELEIVEPDVLVLLGSTVAKALLGSTFRLTKNRGAPLDSDLAPLVFATVHPASVLRSGDRQADALAELVADLRIVADALRLHAPPK